MEGRRKCKWLHNTHLKSAPGGISIIFPRRFFPFHLSSDGRVWEEVILHLRLSSLKRWMGVRVSEKKYGSSNATPPLSAKSVAGLLGQPFKYQVVWYVSKTATRRMLLEEEKKNTFLFSAENRLFSVLCGNRYLQKYLTDKGGMFFRMFCSLTSFSHGGIL